MSFYSGEQRVSLSREKSGEQEEACVEAASPRGPQHLTGVQGDSGKDSRLRDPTSSRRGFLCRRLDASQLVGSSHALLCRGIPEGATDRNLLEVGAVSYITVSLLRPAT